MRHKIVGKKIGRNSNWRKATIRDIAKATLLFEKIRTTRTKAKEARKLVDRLITLGKKDTLAARRKAFSILCEHKIVNRLFSQIAGRYKSRQGGYTRLISLGHRRGDGARLVYLELTERLEKDAPKPKSSKKRIVEKGISEEEPLTAPSKNMLSKKKEVPSDNKKRTEESSKELPKQVFIEPKEEEKIKADPTKVEKKKIVGGFKELFRKRKSRKDQNPGK